MLRRFLTALAGVVNGVKDTVSEVGQTTAEYALVILGAAAIGTLVITWATKSHTIGKLFDTIIGKILPG
jgi:hypothetical protein